MAYQNVDVFVRDTSPVQDPIPDVTVRAYSMDGKLLYGESKTDIEGYAGFLLDEETYQLRFYKFGVGFVNPKFIEVINSSNVFDILADILTPPASSDPRLCTAYGFFRDSRGAPASHTQLFFNPKFTSAVIDAAAIVPDRASVRTDERGYAQVNLFRRGKYYVTVGVGTCLHCIEVPSAPSAKLPDLIYPYVRALTFLPPIPATLSAGGADFQVTPSGMRSDGHLMDQSEVAEALQFSSSDPSVLAVIPAGGVLTLRPLAAGTAEVRATRTDQTVVRIPEATLDGVPALVGVL